MIRSVLNGFSCIADGWHSILDSWCGMFDSSNYEYPYQTDGEAFEVDRQAIQRDWDVVGKYIRKAMDWNE